MKVYKAVDFIQWVWKQVWNIDYSRSKIRQDIRQGAVKINNYKIKETDIFKFDDEQ
jgi:23S rRNA-/tRNA-specific pseudouridylate synthase